MQLSASNPVDNSLPVSDPVPQLKSDFAALRKYIEATTVTPDAPEPVRGSKGTEDVWCRYGPRTALVPVARMILQTRAVLERYFSSTAFIEEGRHGLSGDELEREAIIRDYASRKTNKAPLSELIGNLYSKTK